jgi:hypothetical protein
MSKTAYKVAITTATAVAIFGFSGAAIAKMDMNDPSTETPKEAMSQAAPTTPTTPSTPAPEGEVPAPTIDTDNDGKMDAWDRDSNGVPDAWDKDGDNKPDAMDDDGDGRPDKKDKEKSEPQR